MQIEAINLKVGVKAVFDGEVYVVTDYFHGRTAQRRANVRVKMKNVKTGHTLEKTFLSHDKVERAETDTRNMQFLYADSEYHFMDTKTYDQMAMTKKQVGDAAKYLTENMEVPVHYFNGDPLGIDLPTSVVLRVRRTEPGLKGDTVSNVRKPAELETGLTVQVPLFINEGEKIKVDTRTGEYLERA
jgi:elongation factor P